jgi:hypothetical protein
VVGCVLSAESKMHAAACMIQYLYHTYVRGPTKCSRWQYSLKKTVLQSFKTLFYIRMQNTHITETHYSMHAPCNYYESARTGNRKERADKERLPKQRNPTQIKRIRCQKMHRRNSTRNQTIPQKSSSRIDPNSGKARSNPRTKKGKKLKNTVNENHSFNWEIPVDNWRIRASIPNSKLKFYYTNLEIYGPLSRTPKGKGNLGQGKIKVERGKGDGSSLILFNRAITQFQCYL